MNLGQRFHDKASVKVINEIAHTIEGVIPRAVWILILQNEVEIPFRDPPVIFVIKNLRSAGQEKRPISGGIDNSSFIMRSVGATAGCFRYPKVFDVVRGVARN